MVVATKTPKGVESAIAREKLHVHQVKDDTWLLVFDGTARELADKLGIRKGISGSGLVCSISNYSGRANSEVWEWLRVNWPEDA
jgi:hypothetical protein